jgi:hypothetical protein
VFLFVCLFNASFSVVLAKPINDLNARIINE